MSVREMIKAKTLFTLIHGNKCKVLFCIALQLFYHYWESLPISRPPCTTIQRADGQFGGAASTAPGLTNARTSFQIRDGPGPKTDVKERRTTWRSGTCGKAGTSQGLRLLTSIQRRVAPWAWFPMSSEALVRFGMGFGWLWED